MAEEAAVLRVGDVMSLTGATRRTLQYYDRIGLLPAGRDAAGRRTYTAADVTRLQFVQMLTSLGVPLADIDAAVPVQTTDLDLLVRQRSVLEIEEMRIRGRRVVIDAIVSALEAVPGGRITADALPALIDSGAALPAYADLVRAPGGATVDPTDTEKVDFVVEVYFRWKAVSVRALVLAENGVAPSSPAGVDIGRDWQAYLDLAGDGVVDQSTFEKGRADTDIWPAVDRVLLARTESYIATCHDAYLRTRT